MEYIPTIGLEIHAELKTKTKMFCGCLNNSDEKKPNINVCPICMGHPGTLPVINAEAVKKVLVVGRALKGTLAEYSQFDRKNYFYPDLPKGYQISQYKYPLVSGGELNGIEITRIHLEEDTGKLIHSGDSHGRVCITEVPFGGDEERFSYADFNRAGVPLMELVTEPVIKSAIEARQFAEELQLILRYLNVSNADMEKGQMRVEANISLSKSGGGNIVFSISVVTGKDSKNNIAAANNLGTKVEIKNLNSFKAVERAINYEIERQEKLLEKGEKIKHETRGWDENKQKTFAQREKEKSHDYRYFPEPDLPSLDLAARKQDFQEEVLLPELPQQKRYRFKKEYNFKDEQIEIFIRDKNLCDFFEEAASEVGKDFVFLTANYITTDLIGLLKEKFINGQIRNIPITPFNFAELVKMIAENKVSSRAGKDILKIMFETGKGATAIIKEKGIEQMDDSQTIEILAKEIIVENPCVVEDYKKGKESALQFLIGQAMKKTKGGLNLEIFTQTIKNLIK